VVSRRAHSGGWERLGGFIAGILRKAEGLRVCCLLALSVAAGCGHRQAPGVRLSQAEREDRDYLRLVVALGERDPDSIDYYFGPEEWVSDVRREPPSLAQIRHSALGMADALKREKPDPQDAEPQREFLIHQLRAIASRADLLLGAKESFDEETEAFFGVRAPVEADQRQLARVRSELNRLLPGKGDLAQRYTEFERGFVVPPRRLQAVMNRALEGCRDETLKHIPMPRGDEVTVQYVHNQPWSGFSRYEGGFHSVIQVNTDFGHTVDQVLELACHEGYPGHHVYNSIRDSQLVREEHMTEFMAQPTFSPQSLASEAAATFAVEVAFPWPARTKFERDAMFPLARIDSRKAARYCRVEELVDQLHSAELPIARDYLDGRLEFVRAGDALESQTLMADSDATLKYINEYRSYMTTYTFGRDLVADVVDRDRDRTVSDTVRWQRYRQLMMSLTPLQELSRPTREPSGSAIEESAAEKEGSRSAKRL
jgi:hypothetical protein